MPQKDAIQLFNCLITPVALYACKYWLPFSITKKGWKNKNYFLKNWETFKAELLNQKLGSLILSVNKKASKLAILGELANYHPFIRAIELTLKYEWHLNSNSSANSLVHNALMEM